MSAFAKTLSSAALALTVAAGVSFASTDAKAANLAETAAAAGSFQTLIAAATAAGAVPYLTGDQPYTVFAPTDEAFAKLPAGTVDNLLLPENRATLRKIIALHIVPGTIPSSAVLGEQVAPITMALDYIYINGVTDNGVFIDTEAADYPSPNSAQVIQPDVMADNGVIHVIDNVLLP